jgi:hypothetical protein
MFRTQINMAINAVVRCGYEQLPYIRSIFSRVNRRNYKLNEDGGQRCGSGFALSFGSWSFFFIFKKVTLINFKNVLFLVILIRRGTLAIVL